MRDSCVSVHSTIIWNSGNRFWFDRLVKGRDSRQKCGCIERGRAHCWNGYRRNGYVLRKNLALALFPIIILGACGSKSESDKSEKVEISEIVSTTCMGLLTANTDSEASAVLQTGAALAEMIGVIAPEEFPGM